MKMSDKKLCLDCAVRKLAGKDRRSCPSCAAINLDRMEILRKRSARASRFKNFSHDEWMGK